MYINNLILKLKNEKNDFNLRYYNYFLVIETFVDAYKQALIFVHNK